MFTNNPRAGFNQTKGIFQRAKVKNFWPFCTNLDLYAKLMRFGLRLLVWMLQLLMRYFLVFIIVVVVFVAGVGVIVVVVAAVTTEPK